MFERFTERARRVIFFARYEASQFGSMTIEPEHLLLGLLREDRDVTNRFLPAPAGQSIRNDVAGRLTVREKVSTSHDLPLSPEAKRILAYSAEEAEKLHHRHIGQEHVLLGILREEKCLAAQVLGERGLKLETAREELSRTPMPTEPEPPVYEPRPVFPFMVHSPALPKEGIVPDAETAVQIAEVVWGRLYTPQAIAEQAPLRADLRHNVWIVTGSSQAETALFAFILQQDGRILSVGRGTEGPQKST
jgi:hypothetical protein